MRVLRSSLKCGPTGPAVFLLFYLFYLPAACSDPTGLVMVTPALEAFEARLVAFRFQGEWGLLVEARLVEGDLSLTPNVRVPIGVRTSAGDAEDLVLRPRICGTCS